MVLDRAQLIVALDYPRWLSYGRLLRRTAARMITREPVCNGNVESLRNVLARDSILWFHFRSFGRKRRRIGVWENDPAAPAVQRFTSPRQLALALAGPLLQRDRRGPAHTGPASPPGPARAPGRRRPVPRHRHGRLPPVLSEATKPS